MTLKLYYFEASPPARAVLMVIELLQLKVQLIRVNLSEKEQLNEEFLQVNNAINQLRKSIIFI